MIDCFFNNDTVRWEARNFLGLNVHPVVAIDGSVGWTVLAKEMGWAGETLVIHWINVCRFD